ncbi:response regulator [Candidatus Uhrbacteria bacterium]|nr:response regulator [Candidatus Uhrbacteria bacterium]
MTVSKIVCIDDDPFYRDLYVNILETKGFRVVTAGDPEEGLKAIREHHPDLVTLDVMMPESQGVFDGYGLLKRLRDEPETANLPVIMISALGDREDAEHGLKVGARAYLPKHEMTPDGLVEMIADILSEKSEKAENAPEK